nr:immunoglobulin heavy chain junction region [Macaca mulatta]MOW75372.1 immunoglobulin heavy chain junction region [Macaca mulatta]MOW75447.1 immunoglobulin heavy chain junction region [Macaca mulatta]MOW75507.1 immunoglobulin heavy chain junction region [Macaca mulatta]MOW75668.1 immunoglobulin heavy chain junction region [Macaca mulatta]
CASLPDTFWSGFGYFDSW